MDIEAYLALTLSVAFFVGLHLGVSGSPLRARLIGRIGLSRYRGVYAALALLCLCAIVASYRAAPLVVVWQTGLWGRCLPVIAGVPALILITASAMAPNPTANGLVETTTGVLPVDGVIRVTRNPQLWSIGLIMAAHGLALGDLASIIVFGGLAGLAIGGSYALDRRLARMGGERWSAFAAQTSNLPFAAIIDRRQHLNAVRISNAAAFLALVLWIAILFVHPRLL